MLAKSSPAPVAEPSAFVALLFEFPPAAVVPAAVEVLASVPLFFESLEQETTDVSAIQATEASAMAFFLKSLIVLRPFIYNRFLFKCEAVLFAQLIFIIHKRKSFVKPKREM